MEGMYNWYLLLSVECFCDVMGFWIYDSKPLAQPITTKALIQYKDIILQV